MAATAAVQQDSWVSLNTPPEELLLANTLVTGQSFRWRSTTQPNSLYDTYTGVIGQRLVEMRQLPADVQYRVLARSASEDPAADAAVIRDYFNLGTSLTQLSQHWAARDPRYALVAPALPGCRMLRQDPVECLFQFICSSNNHISRIHGMVERLCSTYGSRLEVAPPQSHKQQLQEQQQPAAASPDSSINYINTPQQPGGNAMHPAMQQQQSEPASGATLLPFQQQQAGVYGAAPTVGSLGQPQEGVQLWGEQQAEQEQQELPSFFAFPTLEQLSAATEDALRADGFGYRAKFIVGSVQQLLSKPEGGAAWLLGLRALSYAEAHEALCSLPGVGPKVAACICLFSLDKHDAIPVDTHVWTLATRYYAPHLAKKSLTPKLHAEVQQAFVERFGPYAGWAHNCLFISELASHKPLLHAGRDSSAATTAATTAAAGESMAKQAAAQMPSKRKAVDVGDSRPPVPGAEQPAAVSVLQADMVVLKQDGAAAPRRRRKPTAKHPLQPATPTPVLGL